MQEVIVQDLLIIQALHIRDPVPQHQIQKNGITAHHVLELENVNIALELENIVIVRMVNVEFAEEQVAVQDVKVKVVGISN